MRKVIEKSTRVCLKRINSYYRAHALKSSIHIVKGAHALKAFINIIKGAHALKASIDIANGAQAFKASIHISKVAHALRAYSSTRPILVNLPWVIKTILFGALLQAT